MPRAKLESLIRALSSVTFPLLLRSVAPWQAFLAAVVLDTTSLGTTTTRAALAKFTSSQLQYTVGGATGWSFVVGYGTSYPQHVHHPAASWYGC